MSYRHCVQKWRNGIFVKETSETTEYYSLGAYLEGDDDIDDTEVDTLGELYKLWQEAKEGDKASGEKGWKYHFYKHSIKEQERENGKVKYVDYVTEGKIYRRKNKVYFKALTS